MVTYIIGKAYDKKIFFHFFDQKSVIVFCQFEYQCPNRDLYNTFSL